jgi:hypothetical protein
MNYFVDRRGIGVGVSLELNRDNGHANLAEHAAGQVYWRSCHRRSLQSLARPRSCARSERQGATRYELQTLFDSPCVGSLDADS